MPRLAYETPCRPLRRQAERDRFLTMIKLAAFVVAIGLVGGFYLLSGGLSREPGRAVAAPAAPTTTTPSIVAPPVVSTVTSEVVPTPEPAPEPPPAEPPAPSAPPSPSPSPPRGGGEGGADRFAVVGEGCPRDGMYSMTARYEPVRCRRGEWELIRMR